MGPERGLQPRLCDRVICAEEGSELDDVANEVFAADDVTRRCCCNITIYHPEKEQFGVEDSVWDRF